MTLVKTTPTVAIERDMKHVLQNLVWAGGSAMDAIRNTNGIEEVRQTFLSSMEGETDGHITSFLIEVRPKSDMNVYKLARTLERKLEAAEKYHKECFGRGWKAHVLYDSLHYDAARMKRSSGVSTDLWGRPVVHIAIEPWSNFTLVKDEEPEELPDKEAADLMEIDLDEVVAKSEETEVRDVTTEDFMPAVEQINAELEDDDSDVDLPTLEPEIKRTGITSNLHGGHELFADLKAAEIQIVCPECGAYLDMTQRNESPALGLFFAKKKCSCGNRIVLDESDWNYTKIKFTDYWGNSYIPVVAWARKNDNGSYTRVVKVYHAPSQKFVVTEEFRGADKDDGTKRDWSIISKNGGRRYKTIGGAGKRFQALYLYYIRHEK